MLRRVLLTISMCTSRSLKSVLVLLAQTLGPFGPPKKRVKGWGQSVKLGPHSAIWGKLGTALQAYALNPCTKFAPNPTSRKVNT